MKKFLRFISSLYAGAAELERRFFLNFSFLVEQPQASVISIGNLSIGGTGKTPFLLALLGEKSLSSKRVVLTRGYKSPWEYSFYLLYGQAGSPKELTDEARMISAAFPETPILVGKNRAHAARLAEKWFKPEIILLDDGFQYRRLRRDLDIVLWDSTMSPTEAEPLPSGILREAPKRLADAHLLVLTRCELASSSQIAFWKSYLNEYAPQKPILEMQTQPHGWVDPNGKYSTLESGPKRVLAFAAIAKPNTFVLQLRSLGCEVVELRALRDHSALGEVELAKIADIANKARAELVCTTKDRIKISAESALRYKIWTLETIVKPLSGVTLDAALRSVGIDLSLLRRRW